MSNRIYSSPENCWEKVRAAIEFQAKYAPDTPEHRAYWGEIKAAFETIYSASMVRP